jgi:hypothetical protein
MIDSWKIEEKKKQNAVFTDFYVIFYTIQTKIKAMFWR